MILSIIIAWLSQRQEQRLSLDVALADERSGGQGCGL
jgi:hypothetical protein